VRNVLLVAQIARHKITALTALSLIFSDWTRSAIKTAPKGIFPTPLKESAKIVPTIAILATYMETV